MGHPQHYVLVIHGTFNAPEPGETKWYQPRGAFARELEQRLSETELQGAVWPEHGFSWSGENEHDDRQKAGNALSNEIDRIAAQDPAARIHIVGHSHGGNVMLAAIQLQNQSELRRIREFLYDLTARTDASSSSKKLLDELPPTEASQVKGFVAKYKHLPKHKLLWNIRTFLKDEAALVQVLLATRCFNRVGRLVFVGTPFLRKRWLDAGGILTRVATRPLRNLLAIPMLIFSSYFLVLAYAVLASAFPSVSFIGPDPRAWPAWVLWAGGAVLLVAAATTLYDEKRYNTNLYFDERANAARPAPARYESLVVSARYFDEALLALSSESIVYAQIVPQIDALLRINPANRNASIVGIDSTSLAETYSRTPRRIAGWIIRFVNWMANPLWALVRAVVRPLVVRTLIDATNAAAFGVPAAQVKGSRITASFELAIAGAFLEVNRDVSAVALDRSLLRESSRAEALRYTFLIDDTVLAARKAALEATTKQNSWRRLKAALPALYDRYTRACSLDPPGSAKMMSEKEYESEIARMWFTLSERFRETSGSVELVHSLYYSNSSVIDMIGRFLVSGDPGDGPVSLNALAPSHATSCSATSLLDTVEGRFSPGTGQDTVGGP